MICTMNRRELIGLFSGAAVMAASPVGAQAMPVIGFLGTESPELWASRVQAFRKALNESGLIEGQNVAIEFRWAEGHYDRLPALAAELVRRQVAVIATNGPGTFAAKTATATIPIVFQGGFDPVAAGIVASLSRPGGNVTGSSGELTPKKLELLHEVLPAVTIVGLLLNPNSRIAYENLVRDAQAAARTMGLRIEVLHASSDAELDKAFAALVQLRAGGLAIGPDAFFAARSKQLGSLAARQAVPAVYQFREFAAAGGLMSYGDSVTDRSRLVGLYTGRILKGEKPTDLPVQQATKAELVINLKTAKALGITIPLPLLGRADEVIE